MEDLRFAGRVGRSTVVRRTVPLKALRSAVQTSVRGSTFSTEKPVSTVDKVVDRLPAGLLETQFRYKTPHLRHYQGLQPLHVQR